MRERQIHTQLETGQSVGGKTEIHLQFGIRQIHTRNVTSQFAGSEKRRTHTQLETGQSVGGKTKIHLQFGIRQIHTRNETSQFAGSEKRRTDTQLETWQSVEEAERRIHTRQFENGQSVRVKGKQKDEFTHGSLKTGSP